MNRMLEIAILSGVGLLFVACVSMVIVFLVVVSKKGSSDSSSGGSGGSGGGDVGTAESGTFRDCNITFFDDPSGFSGVDLFAYGKKKITFEGHTLYPCAVHHDHAAEYMYKILLLEGEGLKPIHCHVVDMCNRKDDPCDPNKDKGGRGFLVDVHETGWDAIGAVTGIIPGRVKVVGSLYPKAMPDDVFLKGSETYVMCECTGLCKEDSHSWVPKPKCQR